LEAENPYDVGIRSGSLICPINASNKRGSIPKWRWPKHIASVGSERKGAKRDKQEEQELHSQIKSKRKIRIKDFFYFSRFDIRASRSSLTKVTLFFKNQNAEPAPTKATTIQAHTGKKDPTGLVSIRKNPLDWCPSCPLESIPVIRIFQNVPGGSLRK
jgi:hypothetical protein